MFDAFSLENSKAQDTFPMGFSATIFILHRRFWKPVGKELFSLLDRMPVPFLQRHPERLHLSHFLGICSPVSACPLVLVTRDTSSGFKATSGLRNCLLVILGKLRPFHVPHGVT